MAEWKVSVGWSKGLLKGKGIILFKPDTNNAKLVDSSTNEVLFDLTSTINASLLFPVDKPKPFQVKGSSGYWITVLNGGGDGGGDGDKDGSYNENHANSTRYQISYTLNKTKYPLSIGYMIQRGPLSMFYSENSILIHQKRTGDYDPPHIETGQTIALGDMIIEINAKIGTDTIADKKTVVNERWTCLYTKDKHKKIKKWIDSTLLYEDGMAVVKDGDHGSSAVLYKKTFAYEMLEEGHEFESSSFLFQLCDKISSLDSNVDCNVDGDANGNSNSDVGITYSPKSKSTNVSPKLKPIMADFPVKDVKLTSTKRKYSIDVISSVASTTNNTKHTNTNPSITTTTTTTVETTETEITETPKRSKSFILSKLRR